MSANTESQKYQQQRLQAIRSAAAVFAEKGFHGSSTRDIAEHMGIKQGSLYYYFKSKEEALGEVCLFGIEDYADHMKLIAASENFSGTQISRRLQTHPESGSPAKRRCGAGRLLSHETRSHRMRGFHQAAEAGPVHA